MTYSGLRIIIAIIYIILNVLVLRLLKIKKSKAKIAILISIICFVVFTTYIATLIESKWIKFDTVEQSFNYSYPNKEIVKIVEKDNYAIILYEYDSETRTVTFFKKVNDKWLVTNPNNPNLSDEFVYPYGVTTDLSTDGKTRFVVVSFSEVTGAKKDITVRDNYDTKFERIETMEKSGYIMHDYYGTIDNITGDYYLTIDGIEYLLNTKSYTNIIFIITVVSCGIVWIIIYMIIKYIQRKKKQ